MKMEKSSTISSTSSVSLLPTSASSSEDGNLNASPSRLPTFKDYAETIKKLEHENFQLKLRIYMNEVRHGKSSSSHSQSHTGPLSGSTSVPPSSEFVIHVKSLEEQLRDLRVKLLTLNEDLSNKGTQIQTLEASINERNEVIVKYQLQVAQLNAQLSGLHVDMHELKHSQAEEYSAKLAESEMRIKELREKLDITAEDVTTKSQLISSLEKLLKDKNEHTGNLDRDNTKLNDKIVNMTDALKIMGFRHADEEERHGKLKERYRELTDEYDKVHLTLQQVKREFEEMAARCRNHRSNDLSPDLGIESGHDGHQAPGENILKVSKGENSSEETVKVLKSINRELATKLKQTKTALDKTLERLNKMTSDKEQVEKAICRQLHRTHGILRAARKNLEDPGEPAAPLTVD